MLKLSGVHMYIKGYKNRAICGHFCLTSPDKFIKNYLVFCNIYIVLLLLICFDFYKHYFKKTLNNLVNKP
jgi:hypothetical protein